MRTTPRLLCSAYWVPLAVKLRDFMMDVVYFCPVLLTALNFCSASHVWCMRWTNINCSVYGKNETMVGISAE